MWWCSPAGPTRGLPFARWFLLFVSFPIMPSERIVLQAALALRGLRNVAVMLLSSLPTRARPPYFPSDCLRVRLCAVGPNRRVARLGEQR